MGERLCSGCSERMGTPKQWVRVLLWPPSCVWPMALPSRLGFMAEQSEAQHTSSQAPCLCPPAPGHKPWLHCQTIWAVFHSSLYFTNTKLVFRGSWRCLLLGAGKGPHRKAIFGMLLVCTSIAAGKQCPSSNPC